MYNLFGFLIAVLIVIGAAFFDRYYPTIYYKSSSKKADLSRANALYQCPSCELLTRKYQRDMYVARHDKTACPHCEKGSGFRNIQISDSWVDTHPHCPKIDAKGLKEVNKTINLLVKLKNEEKEQLRFQNYNKLKADFSWANNLQKEIEEIK